MWEKFYSRKVNRIGLPLLLVFLLIITIVNYFHQGSTTYKSALVLVNIGLIVVVLIVNIGYSYRYSKKNQNNKSFNDN